MTKLMLSTSNIMSGRPSVVRRPTAEKSNTELINALRSNFQAARDVVASSGDTQDARLKYTTWTGRDGDLVFVPAPDSSASGLAEERAQYDITVKLFFLPTTRTAACGEHAREAIALVLRELRVPSIDLLIVSFPGVTFDADDDEDEDVEDNETEARRLEDMVDAWRALEELHGRGTVARIGLAEFGSERLKRFLPRIDVRPSVDQINVRDCCVVPKSLILYAKQEGIQLLTHNDSTDILPKGTVREILGGGVGGAGVLSSDGYGEGLTGEVEPQWVVKYTAVVRDRGVIEGKGYFAMAELLHAPKGDL